MIWTAMLAVLMGCVIWVVKMKRRSDMLRQWAAHAAEAEMMHKSLMIDNTAPERRQIHAKLAAYNAEWKRKWEWNAAHPWETIELATPAP